MTEHYSEALHQTYELIGDGRSPSGVEGLIFEDGVKYTMLEAVYLSRASDADIRALHAIKKAFSGEILIPGVNDGWTQSEGWSAKKVYHIAAGTVSKIDKKKNKILPDAEAVDLFS